MTTLPDPPAAAPSRANQDNATFSAAIDDFLSWVTSLFGVLPDWMNEVAQLLTGAYTGTSTDSVAIGTGTKNFPNASTGRGWIGGHTVRITDHANPANYMLGTVTSYNATTGALVVSVPSGGTGGSGTKTAWDISLEISVDLSAYLQKAGGTMTGLLTLIAAASGQEALVIPHGAAPTSPTDGSIWTTINGLFARINGTTRQYSSLDAVQTFTNKTFTGYTETVVAPAAGSAFSPDLSAGTQFYYQTNANTTITLPTPAAGKSFTVTVAYGGAHTLTFAGGARKWPGGAAPTATSTSGKKDIYTFNCTDGSNWDGSQIPGLA